MKQEYFFGDAKWVGDQGGKTNRFRVLRGHFECAKNSNVTLNVLGLGFFKCYINGTLINPDTFLPLSSDYEATCDPDGEVLTGHRVYVPEFDITPYVREGNNVIAVHYGGGWYTDACRCFGEPKAIWRIIVSDDGSKKEFVSNEDCLIADSYITDYDLKGGVEKHELGLSHDLFGCDVDESKWAHAQAVKALESDYLSTDCPRDTLIKTLNPSKIGCGEHGTIYDCGENTVGTPVLKITAKAGETVRAVFSEKLLPDGKIDPDHVYGQHIEIISDGTEKLVQAEFTWFGFRYFELIGDASVECVKVIHADVPVTSSFECDNEVLNWTYKTFIHTMLCNMHCGHPSDCPQIERRGYTGDGQLSCNAVLSIFDAKSFYEKWLCDIADCQDKLSGHVQYTAPYQNCGGGPGGWGCAIIEVPYRLYKHYGEIEILEKYYENMRRYLDYLDAHSEFGLVTSDKEGSWCLGDWCSPQIAYSDTETELMKFHPQQIIIPPPMVNTYFFVRSLERMSEIAHLIGRDEDISGYKEKAEYHKRALRAAYSSNCDGNYLMNVHGANAFAVDLGIGIEKLVNKNVDSYGNMVEHYERLGYFDTGVFATDVVTRVLFEHGDGELAVKLLANTKGDGYGRWREHGVTTFTEYWNDAESRSQNHPMFGAPVAYFFEYLLGIRQTEDSAGYKSLCIEPQAVECFGRMSGSMNTPHGKVEVSYEKKNERVEFRIYLPQGIDANFKYDEHDIALSAGENRFVL